MVDRFSEHDSSMEKESSSPPDRAIPASSGGRPEARSSPTQLRSERIVIGDLVMSNYDHGAWVKDHAIPLTHREFAVLWCLASLPGKVFERQELLKKVWGAGEFVEPRTVDAHVVKVRRKLHAYCVSGVRIETIWGTGYRLQVDGS